MNFLKGITTNVFVRNVFVVMTGSGLAQIIPILMSPLLTRLYTPEDFGYLAVFVTLVTLLSGLISGKYELGILVPRSNLKADRLYLSVMFLVICMFLMLFIVSLSLQYNIISKFSIKTEYHIFFILVPIGALFYSLFQINLQYSLRYEQYNKMSLARVIQSIVSSVILVVVGMLFNYSNQLIYFYILSFIAAFLILFDARKLFGILTRRVLVGKYFFKYSSFPKYLMPAFMLNVISLNVPVFVLLSLFSTQIVGYYTLVIKVLGAPVLLFAVSLGEVFKQKASVEYSQTNQCKALFLSTFKYLILLSIFPFLILYIISPYVFVYVFGKDWAVAGEYAQILIPMFFVKFITMPLSSVIVLAGKNKLDFFWQLSFLLVSFGAFYINSDILDILSYISVSFSLLYAVSFLINLNLACGSQNEFR